MEQTGQVFCMSAPSANQLGSNQSSVREYNERLMLTLLRRVGSLTKADIARITGLSAPAVSVIVRELESEGLLVRGVPVKGKVGQPGVPMSIAEDGVLFLGLKVGRRSADLILINFIGKIIDRERVVYAYPDPDQVMLFVEQAMIKLTSRLDPQLRARISGMGIALPGYLWEWASNIGVKPSSMSAWKTIDLRQQLANLCNFPVYQQNDASCACGAENVFGTLELSRDTLYFYIGHFIGGGVIIDGKLFVGQTGNAAAIGTLPVVRQGRVGQLVDEASLAKLELLLQRGGSDPSFIFQDPENWPIAEPIIHQWVQNCARELTSAIVSACSIIDFQNVVLDGWLPRPILKKIVDGIQGSDQFNNWPGIVLPNVLTGSIGPDARSVGAASLPLSEKFLVN